MHNANRFEFYYSTLIGNMTCHVSKSTHTHTHNDQCLYFGVQFHVRSRASIANVLHMHRSRMNVSIVLRSIPPFNIRTHTLIGIGNRIYVCYGMFPTAVDLLRDEQGVNHALCTRLVETQRSDLWKVDVFIKGAVCRAIRIRGAVDGTRAIDHRIVCHCNHNQT